MTRPRLGSATTLAIAAIPVLFLAYFFAYPLVSITVRGLSIDGSLDLSVFGDVISDPTLQGVALFTLWQAILSTILTLAVGLPTAWVFARYRFRGRNLLFAATLVPFILPTLVVGTAFLNLFGPRGATGIDLSGTLAIILLAHVFYNFAVVVRGVGTYWRRIDPSLVEAARTLGASPFGAFRRITLPLLSPAIASTAALVFLFSFTSFGVVLLLGDLAHSTIEVEIWRQATSFLRLDVASTLAVLQILGIGAILAVYGHFERTTQAQFRTRITPLRTPRRGRERATVVGVITAATVFLAVPLGILLARSFIEPGGGFGIANYRNLWRLPEQSAAFVPAQTAIGNSFQFAAIAIVVAAVIGLLAALTLSYAPTRAARGFDVFVMLPLGTSAVTIGFGFLIALDRPWDIRTSLMLIPIAHALVGIPFVVRAISPTLASIQHRLREAAATLGATPWQSFVRIDLRLVARSLLVGAAFAFAISMGEFGATTFIARPATPTIPIAIFRYLGRPGEAPFGAALALSAILMIITGASIFAIDALGRRREDRT